MKITRIENNEAIDINSLAAHQKDKWNHLSKKYKERKAEEVDADFLIEKLQTILIFS